MLIKMETVPLSADGAKTASMCDAEESNSVLLLWHKKSVISFN